MTLDTGPGDGEALPFLRW